MSVVTAWVVPLLGCVVGIIRHTIATREILAVRSGKRLGVRAAAPSMDNGTMSLHIRLRVWPAAGPQPVAFRSYNPQLLWMGCLHDSYPQLVCFRHGRSWPALQHMDDILSISLRLI